MLNEFKKLTEEEVSLLMKAPALLSVLAACSEGGVNGAEKADAIRMSHLRTFTADFTLLDYYREVEKTFVQDFEMLAAKYFPLDEEKKEAIALEIKKTDQAIANLDPANGLLLHKSLDSYIAHVKRAGRSIFFDFIFPLPITGITG